MANANIEIIRQLVESSGMDAPTILGQREAIEASAGAMPPPAGVTVEPITIGGCPAEWLIPEDAVSDHVVIYLHGGGYCIGSINTHRDLAGRLALALGGRVLNLDYRLAPEHPMPAAIDDVVAAYGELLAQGIRPADIAIAGDSAGGGLTVAALLAIRDTSTPMPAAGACLSPWVDLTQSAPTYLSRAEVDPMVTKAGLDTMAAAYLGDQLASDPLASPARADLTGLPPLIIQVGDAEVLLDDSLALRDAAVAGGVEVQLDVWPEMIHVFQVFPDSMLPESAESIAGVAAFLSARMG